MMRQYRHHPIYGIGTRGPNKRWSWKGIVFDPSDHVTEIKRLESAERTFATEDEAREHGLKECKIWIDEQNGAGH